MKLYYHKTDGGAEYYCLKPVRNSVVGDLTTAVVRTDGDEVEIFTNNLRDNNIKLVIS